MMFIERRTIYEVERNKSVKFMRLLSAQPALAPLKANVDLGESIATSFFSNGSVKFPSPLSAFAWMGKRFDDSGYQCLGAKHFDDQYHAPRVVPFQHPTGDERTFVFAPPAL
jgi:hypothetical protein